MGTDREGRGGVTRREGDGGWQERCDSDREWDC